MASSRPKAILSYVYIACLRGNTAMIREILTVEPNIGIMSSYDPLHPTSPRTELHRSPGPIANSIIEYIITQSTNLTLHDGNPLKWSTTLHYAIETGNHMLLRIAMQYNPDVDIVDCYGCAPLHIAVWKDNAEATKLLLDAGANIRALSKWGRTPLVDARRRYASMKARNLRAESGDAICVSAEVIWLLLEKEDAGSYDDDQERPLLHVAVGYQHVSLVEKLLASGVDVGSRDRYGRTALHTAAKRGNPAVLMLLIEHGADPEATDNFGRKPVDLLPLIATSAELKRMKDLLESGLEGHA